MILAAFDLLCFTLGFLALLPTACYEVWLHWATTPEATLQLMIAMPLVMWASAYAYLRSYQVVRQLTISSTPFAVTALTLSAKQIQSLALDTPLRAMCQAMLRSLRRSPATV